ncbi:hypothetical protein [Ciceribacter thiooxidans]|uniref:DnrO protein n=1 Tax=Ciceribacter thiooxidans TaxID=1969821 RepID=A0ABV7IAT9_9HYPH|nr:hypothetical protein [Ciceribacter thiooxidans]
MNFRRHLILPGLVFALGAWSAPSWAATTSHEGHQAATIELTLNGQTKWQGDENMLKGMDGIRSALATRLPAIHDASLQPADYKTLASEVQAQVDFMVTNCKLAPEVDEQFHIVLGHVLDGVAELEGDADPRSGAVLVVQALNAYGTYFEHPNWQPLE